MPASGPGRSACTSCARVGRWTGCTCTGAGWATPDFAQQNMRSVKPRARLAEGLISVIAGRQRVRAAHKVSLDTCNCHSVIQLELAKQLVSSPSHLPCLQGQVLHGNV